MHTPDSKFSGKIQEIIRNISEQNDSADAVIKYIKHIKNRNLPYGEHQNHLQINHDNILNKIKEFSKIIIAQTCKFDENSCPKMNLFQHFELIYNICKSFEFTLIILNQNNILYSIGEELDPNDAIYLMRSQHENYSVLIPEKMYELLVNGENVSIFEFPFLLEINFLGNDEQFTIHQLSKIQFGKQQKEETIISLMNHLFEIYRSAPFFFTTLMRYKTQFLPDSEICFACEKILPKSHFKIQCVDHDFIKFCNKHFTESSSCPYCPRELNQEEIAGLLDICILCNKHCNINQFACGACKLCKMCAFNEKCNSCKKPNTENCGHNIANKIQVCTLSSCLFCIECLNVQECCNCGKKLQPNCVECNYQIENNMSIYDECFHFVHKGCKKYTTKGDKESNACRTCYKSCSMHYKDIFLKNIHDKKIYLKNT